MKRGSVPNTNKAKTKLQTKLQTKMKIPKLILACLATFGIMLYGGAVFAQPAFSQIYPNGTNLFQVSSTFSFQASASFSITNVQVQLVGTPLAGGSQVLHILTPATGLNAVGFPGASITANCPLQTNLLYSVTITAMDNAGNTSTTNVSFDTIIPVYTWEAEDWDYQNGKYFDNPQINLYTNLSGVADVDYHDPDSGQGHAYRPSAPNGLATENCGDTVRLTHLGTQDYDVGWNNGGYWGNYTRHYPAGTYYVFLRGASTSAQQRNADLTVAGGNASLNGTGTPYAFKLPLTGNNQIYGWGPLLDSNGKLVTLTCDGTAATLRSTVDQGNLNANFYMLMPTNISNLPVGSISYTNLYPDGQMQFEQTNQFVFTLNSLVGIDSNSIIAQVTATSLLGNVSVQFVSPISGLTVSGTPTSLNGSLLLTTDAVYNIFIQATDLNGVPTSTNITFDTVNPHYYTFEAEDWNYLGGQFIDNPQVNALVDYYQTGEFNGEEAVDDHYTGGGGHANYRLHQATEGCGDITRQQYTVVDPRTGTNYVDFDCGNTSGGSWANYTRTFPAGIYNIYVRAADGGGNNSDSASMGLVTGDTTSTAQTNTVLGLFGVPGTGGWQKYQWVVLLNNIGKPVQWTATGKPMTLRATIDNGNLNVNYYMLVPANTNVIVPPFVSAFTPDGNSMFQKTTALSFIANSQVGVNASNIRLNLNGVNVNGFSTSGSPNQLNISYPVQTNQYYTAMVTITDSHGTTTTTNVFDTFDPNVYTFESEDYDYNGGQFIDNPVTVPGAYNGLSGVVDVDDHWDHQQGSYRPSSGANEGLTVEGSGSGDQVRPGFSGYDYDIGFNDGGNWANYTRNYPAGTYNIYLRSASPNNASTGGTANFAKVSIVTGGWGTTNQTLTDIGTFFAPYTGGWGTYHGWAPLMQSGRLVQFVSTGSTNTLRVTIVNGNANQDFLALVPADTNSPTIANAYPDGTYKFQGSATNALTFTASAAGGLNSSGVSVLLSGTNLLGQAFSTNITTANGLTVVSGSSTSLNLKLNLAANTAYTAVITVTAVNGEETVNTLSFDTIQPALTFEAEDWNYTDTNSGLAGLFINNPQTNAYFGLASTAGIDYSNSVIGQGSSNYRPQGLETENVSDNTPPRQAYATGQQDYNLGFNNGGSGNWGNYTRTFPSGVYNIYMRGSKGDNTNQPVDSASLALVTSGATTMNQTTLPLGTFAVPNVGGWQAFSNVPLIDSDGNHAEFVGGSQQTLRVTTDNGGYNVNYYYIVAADTTLPINPPHLKASRSGTNVLVSFLTRTNTTYTLQFKAQLTDPAWIPVSTNSGTSLWTTITNGMNGASGFYSLKP
jgi:hypothetical protein